MPTIAIQFDYSFDSSGFFSDATRRDILDLAAVELGSRLDDSLEAIQSGGGNSWSAKFSDPSTGNNRSVSNLSVPADTIIVYVGARNMNSLGVGGPGGFSASGSQSWFDTIRARGQAGAQASQTPKTDFGPWGGAITFSLNEDWYFGETTTGLDPDGVQSDFFSVAMHELGHVLGIGTAGSWNRLIDSRATGDFFTGPASVAEYDFGGDVPLSNDASHWKLNIKDNGQEVAMDPDISVGTRKIFTPLDFAGLTDIGWQVSTPLVLDFGDAPSIYPTDLAHNGARHGISGPRLGASVDSETDGQPSTHANGDDTTGLDDEDGVHIQTTVRAGEAGLVSVNLQNAGTAKLDAWIDWNQDGDWSDSGEQIFTSKVLSAGDNTLTFAVPAGAIAGETFARFRVSTVGGLAPTGAASNGEVEDVPVSVIAADISIAPRDLLVYYSFPSLINGANGDLSAAATSFGAYDYVVLGDGLEDPAHADHANTVAIMNAAATSNTQFFGYIDLGVSTQNLTLVQIQQKVDQWLASGADGIFFDDFGYDFNTVRSRQNAAVNYAHSLGLPVVANGFFVNDVFSSAVSATNNPTGTATRLTKADFYLFESYQVETGAIVSGATWRAKADALAAFRATLGTQVLAVTTNDADNDFSQAQFDYAWYSALLDGYEGVGWGELDFASSTADAPFRTRPTDDPGTAFTSNIVASGTTFQRTTSTGKVWVNSSVPTAGFGNTTPTVTNSISDLNASGNNSFSLTLPANTFSDLDGDALTLSTNSLPSWLHFDATTRTFSGLPLNSDVGKTTITVTATDSSSEAVSDSFDLTVVAGATPDIVLNSVTANGQNTLTVQYQILNSNLFSPFGLRFLKSNDDLTDAGDTALSTVTISGAANLSVGSHSLSFTIGTQVLLPGAGVAESSNDYFLLAVADPTNAIVEDDSNSLNEDNTVVFAGAYTTNTVIQVHGGSAADSITLTYPATTSGNFSLNLAGSVAAAQSYPFNQATQFRVRTHGGNDVVSVINTANLAARPMLELGGDGNDTLNGAAGVDTLDGGAGDDTLSGKLGSDNLNGGAGSNTLSELGNINFILTNSGLTGVGTDTLTNLQIANLTGGAATNTFTVTGWTGTGSLVGGGGASDTIIASKDVSFVLSNSGLQSTDGMNLSLSGFTKATLTGGVGNNVFTVGGWTGIATLNGDVGTDTVAATRNADMTLTSVALTAAGFGNLTLSKIENAELTGGAGNNVLTVSNWIGGGSLTGGGGADTVVVNRNANFTLSNSQLVVSSGLSMTLANMSVANLTGGSSANLFLVTGWTGTGTLNGSSGTDRIEATRDTDMTLTNTSLAATGLGTLTLSAIETAKLTGGNSANVLRADTFTLGAVTLSGGNGDDVLVGGSRADSLLGGAGRDLLIGGLGADTLSGEAGDDILIGGTSSHSGNAAALNAIMAEWTSGNLYATRVNNLRNGGGANGPTLLNNTTVQNDSSAADRLTGGTELDWFFQSASDVLVDFSAAAGEITTAI